MVDQQGIILVIYHPEFESDEETRGALIDGIRESWQPMMRTINQHDRADMDAVMRAHGDAVYVWFPYDGDQRDAESAVAGLISMISMGVQQHNDNGADKIQRAYSFAVRRAETWPEEWS